MFDDALYMAKQHECEEQVAWANIYGWKLPVESHNLRAVRKAIARRLITLAHWFDPPGQGGLRHYGTSNAS